jgi:hypothetical protein
MGNSGSLPTSEVSGVGAEDVVVGPSVVSGAASDVVVAESSPEQPVASKMDVMAGTVKRTM